tara:strand:+ start:302 stop:649 length:348 start_codon:yes stop_codon:yes gene_type:complete
MKKAWVAQKARKKLAKIVKQRNDILKRIPPILDSFNHKNFNIQRIKQSAEGHPEDQSEADRLIQYINQYTLAFQDFQKRKQKTTWTQQDLTDWNNLIRGWGGVRSDIGRWWTTHG